MLGSIQHLAQRLPSHRVNVNPLDLGRGSKLALELLDGVLVPVCNRVGEVAADRCPEDLNVLSGPMREVLELLGEDRAEVGG